MYTPHFRAQRQAARLGTAVCQGEGQPGAESLQAALCTLFPIREPRYFHKVGACQTPQAHALGRTHDLPLPADPGAVVQGPWTGRPSTGGGAESSGLGWKACAE